MFADHIQPDGRYTDAWYTTSATTSHQLIRYLKYYKVPDNVINQEIILIINRGHTSHIPIDVNAWVRYTSVTRRLMVRWTGTQRPVFPDEIE